MPYATDSADLELGYFRTAAIHAAMRNRLESRREMAAQAAWSGRTTAQRSTGGAYLTPTGIVRRRPMAPPVKVTAPTAPEGPLPVPGAGAVTPATRTGAPVPMGILPGPAAVAAVEGDRKPRGGLLVLGLLAGAFYFLRKTKRR